MLSTSPPVSTSHRTHKFFKLPLVANCTVTSGKHHLEHLLLQLLRHLHSFSRRESLPTVLGLSTGQTAYPAQTPLMMGQVSSKAFHWDQVNLCYSCFTIQPSFCQSHFLAPQQMLIPRTSKKSSICRSSFFGFVS